MRLKKSRIAAYACCSIAGLLFAVRPAVGQVCGDDVVDAPEECDGTADAACPGLCIPPGIGSECTCMPDCDDGNPDTADGFHEVTDTSIWGWIPGITLQQNQSFHFHVESVTWTSLEKWFDFIADTEGRLSIHVKAVIDGEEVDHLWEEFELVPGEPVSFHGLIETVNITSVWVWVTNIGPVATFDFHLHWIFAGGPSGLPGGCLSVPIVLNPVPALSEWGVVAMALMLLVSGTIVLGRMRTRQAA